mmetsp:Transcript_110721/g.174537  ORF Transcript_110721/g.174537 Transcript_110721/m.174537 type:complete len:203 (-) Transcript_110721:329-937(-)
MQAPLEQSASACGHLKASSLHTRKKVIWTACSSGCPKCSAMAWCPAILSATDCSIFAILAKHRQHPTSGRKSQWRMMSMAPVMFLRRAASRTIRTETKVGKLARIGATTLMPWTSSPEIKTTKVEVRDTRLPTPTGHQAFSQMLQNEMMGCTLISFQAPRWQQHLRVTPICCKSRAKPAWLETAERCRISSSYPSRLLQLLR